MLRMKDAQLSDRWHLKIAALLALTAGNVAQQRAGDAAARVTDDRLQELLQQVAGDDPRGRAFGELLEIGAPAAAAIVAAIERDDAPPCSPQLTRYLLVLGELGPTAVEAIEPLRRLAADASGEHQRQLLDCVLDLAPHLGPEATRVVDDTSTPLFSQMYGDGELALRQRCAETWFRSNDLGNVSGLLLHREVGCEQLLTIAGENLPTFRGEAAVVVLSYAERSTEETAAAIALAAAQLDRPVNRAQVTTSSGGNRRIQYLCGLRSHRRFAAALLRMLPPPAEAAKAHVYLLRHGLAHERWRAIDWLRGDSAALPGAEETLRDLAAAPDTEHQLRCEAITTLGMVRPLGKTSHDALQDLTENADKSIAVRARAALRQHGEQGH